jgi:simple sugar transport system permease protein
VKALGWRQLVLALVAFGSVAACLVAIGVMPQDALFGLLRGSLGTANGWNETLKHTTPLLIAGLAVFIALRAGLFNIGAEGQLLVGALAATAVALRVPSGLGTVLSVLAGTLAGAVWAYPAGWIKAHRNGHEVITTIMLNNVAVALAVGLVAGPLKNKATSSTSTDVVSEATWLPFLYQDPPLRVSAVLPFAILLVWGVAVWVKRTVAGYELRATGANPRAASTAGIEVKRVTVRAMCLSGALAGLAGALQMLAYEHNFYAGFSSGFGFDALGVALLAGGSAWGVVPAAFGFGILAKGTTSIQVLGVPKGLSGILLAALIIVFAAYRYRKERSHD